MITDEDLVPFEFADFFDDEDSDDGDGEHPGFVKVLSREDNR